VSRTIAASAAARAPESDPRALHHRGSIPAGTPFRVIEADAPAGPATSDGQERFAAYVAHELGTEIALQRALVEVALSDPDADAAALRSMGQDVAASCKQQQRLIDALLDLTVGHRGLRRHEPVDIVATVSDALRARDLSEFETVVTLEPSRTTGDPDLVERLAANLVSNATRHNVTGGRIEVETRTENAHAVFSIANTGPFIPAEELTRLFEPFHRLGVQPGARSDDLGLGLAIVRAIADAHHATITAYARAGGGLKIDVGFPTRT
jgi:signal transduction histidine kinase